MKPRAKSAQARTDTQGRNPTPAQNATAGKKRIEQYDHRGKQRANNPPVGLVDAKSDAAQGKKVYAYDPHLDPQ